MFVYQMDACEVRQGMLTTTQCSEKSPFLPALEHDVQVSATDPGMHSSSPEVQSEVHCDGRKSHMHICKQTYACAPCHVDRNQSVCRHVVYGIITTGIALYMTVGTCIVA